MIWQMMLALLHSNGQLRTERDGDTEKGCQKPAVQQKTTDDDDTVTRLVILNNIILHISQHKPLRHNDSELYKNYNILRLLNFINFSC